MKSGTKSTQKANVGRPPVDTERFRMTVLVSKEGDELVRWFAHSRSINLSTAVNLLLDATIRSNWSYLESVSREFNSRRQF